MAENSQIHVPPSHRLTNFMRGPLTVVVWLLAVGVVGLLFMHPAQDFEFIGIARTLPHEISAAPTGQISAALGVPYDEIG